MAAVLEAQAGSERRRQRGAARPRGQAEGGTDKVLTVSGAEKEHGSSFEIECIQKFPNVATWQTTTIIPGHTTTIPD